MVNIRGLVLIFFLAVLTLSISAHARKPAVEPIQGISIDHYNDVPAEKARGYDFNQNQKSAPPSKVTKINPPARKATEISANDLNASGNTLPSSIIFFILAALPVALWFGIMKKLKRDERFEEIDNTIDFESARSRRGKPEHDDHDFPKAG